MDSCVLTRRKFLQATAATGLLAAMPMKLLGNGSKSSSDQSNIIFCMTDDQGWGDVGYNGHPRLKTPELDKMAKENLKLDAFYASAPNCSPTRASCLTGRQHMRTGVANHSQPINPEEITIADALGAQGYMTGLFGKWHLGNVKGGSPMSPAELGWQEYFATENNSEKVNPKGYYHNGQQIKNVAGEDSEIIMNKAMEFMLNAKKRKKKFLSFVWFHTPHTPYGSTNEFLEMYKDVGGETQKYYASLTAMDKQMERLREFLGKTKLHEDTLLVFCSDNGARSPGSNGNFKGRKGMLSEGGTRVPGIIQWPKYIKRAAQSKVPLSTADLYPTFMTAAGAKPYGEAREIDGEDFTPLLKGKRFLRKGPIRFCHGKGRKAVVTVDGKWGKSNIDPGYDTWYASVMKDYNKSLAVIKRLKGK